MLQSLLSWSLFNNNSKILVCKPKFPSSKAINKFLSISRKSGFITNNGPLVKTFAAALQQILAIDNISVNSSGTIALIIMLKALKLKYKDLKS